MTADVQKTIESRKSVHGKFEDVAAMDEGLCLQMEGGVNWTRLTSFQRVSLKMIQHKIARILSGDPNFEDHWHDIIGYAEITRTRLPKEDR